MVNSTGCIQVSSECRIIINIGHFIVVILSSEFAIEIYIRFHKIGKNRVQIPINV